MYVNLRGVFVYMCIGNQNSEKMHQSCQTLLLEDGWSEENVERPLNSVDQTKTVPACLYSRIRIQLSSI